MKLRTNLSPDELEKVAGGLLKLARSRKVLAKATNKPVEQTCIVAIENALELYNSSLRREVQRILLEEDNDV